MLDQIKSWANQASGWIAANPTDVVYAAAILAGFTLLSGFGGRRRR
jgi:hypothetical protein